MNGEPNRDDGVSRARRIDAACWRFEEAWKAAANNTAAPRLEDFVNEFAAAEHAAALHELLAIELAYRRLKGTVPAPESYQRRFPLLVSVIQAAFRKARPEDDGEISHPTGDHHPPPDSSIIPERLGRYRIVAKLGEGGFGIVYRGYDEALHREVAIKVPPLERVALTAQREAYLAEARVLAKLDHPGIVPVYDVGTTDEGRCYLVSKYVAGNDLRQKLREVRFSPRDAAELIALVAEALHYAHQNGLVHRDIKPANILLDGLGRPIVADFGLALRDEDFGTGPAYAGTPAYMSPEQAKGEGHRVDARSDVYSVGVVFYELLTTQRPYRGDTRTELFREIRRSDPKPPRQLDDKVPRELDRICLRALTRRASDRYSTARDFAEDLRLWLAVALPTPQSPVNVQVIVPPPASTHSAAPVADPHSAKTPTPPLPTPSGHSDTDAKSARVVPKGLRSFDREDAEFFLDLLPGPRDRAGLPESLRFWKTRIEDTDPNRTFTVGLLYGPSGCGKSSLVKAGLLPRLADHVTVIYVEATPTETELQLGKALRRTCSGPNVATLPDRLARLRRGQELDEGKKVLLVLDQFEQWLHARDPDADSELVQALRQCDGRRVQVLLLVRNDFWMAATRFLRELEVPLAEGKNAAAADLFLPPHARRVLAKFGQAYGCLPENAAHRTPEQEAFLDRTVAELAQDGKIIPIRLSLFADMVKGRPWTPATLAALGGAEGVGAAFLDETFSAPSAPLPHRVHEKAARAVLERLLPEPGSPLKGAKRTRDELLQASGYVRRPREFDELLRVLDTELRLVTPTETDDEEPAPTAPAYQLTHDYLVPAIRDWLTRKQRETRRGRARLRLADRAALWNSRRENQQLPTWREWLSIHLFTRKKEWNEPQRQLMRKATRYHLLRAGLAGLVLVALSILGWTTYDRRHQERAEARVEQLLNIKTAKLPLALAELEPYRAAATPLLLKVFRDENRKEQERLHAGIALLPTHREEVESHLWERLMEFVPTESGEFTVLRDALLGTSSVPHEQGIQRLEKELDSDTIKRRVRAAVVLLQRDRFREAWDWLKHSADPTRRTYLIHAFAQLDTNPELLLARLDMKQEVSSRRALLLALGEFKDPQLSAADRAALVPRLLKWYEDESDPGLHSAAEWLLRRWGHGAEIEKLDRKLQTSEPDPKRGWYVNRQGQTLAVLRGPIQFDMGSPVSDPESIQAVEKQVEMVIPRSFAIGTKEVTVAQVREFVTKRLPAKNREEVESNLRNLHLLRNLRLTGNDPVVGLRYDEVAYYCNWLSEQERLPQDEWCYEILPKGLVMKPKYLHLTGYRLPTEAEWEYACRAETTTSRFFGTTREMLDRYAQTIRSGPEQISLVGQFKPNDFGLFDTYGNAVEWTSTRWKNPPTLMSPDAIQEEWLKPAPTEASAMIRGGAYSSLTTLLRSASRNRQPMSGRDAVVGFRVARTIREKP